MRTPAPPHYRAAADGAATGSGRFARELLLGLAIGVVAAGGAVWQLDRYGAPAADAHVRTADTAEHVSLLRLVCPLH